MGHKIRNTGRTRFKKGYIPWNKGLKGLQPWHNTSFLVKKGDVVEWSDSRKIKFKEKMTGENHPRWVKDRSLIDMNKRRNRTLECIQWRESVFGRDGYKCKINNQKCNGQLEAHHILPWRDFSELRFNINNGITLCHAHHPRKRVEEKRLILYFQGLVSVS